MKLLIRIFAVAVLHVVVLGGFLLQPAANAAGVTISLPSLPPPPESWYRLNILKPPSAQDVPPPPTPTPTKTPTATSTVTNMPETPTATATSTPTNTPETPTATATNTPTNTPETPSATATSTPTNTPETPTATATNTPTNTPETPTVTATNTPTNTPETPTVTATSTPTNTPETPTATATTTSTPKPTNRPPVAVNDVYNAIEDTELVIPANGILGNDYDLDGDAISVTISSIRGPFTTDAPDTGLRPERRAANQGVLAVNPDGSFSYYPSLDYVGPVTFTYQISDGVYASNVATVTIMVNGVNDPPVAHNDSYELDEDSAIKQYAPGVMHNDHDIDGDDIEAYLLSGPAVGQLTLGLDGSFEFVPPANFNGWVSFRYRAWDGSVKSEAVTVNLYVRPSNDAPIAHAGPDGVMAVNGTAQLDGRSSSDVDGDALTYEWSQVSGPSVIINNANGARANVLAPGSAGTLVFRLTVTDSSNASHSDTATIEVTAQPLAGLSIVGPNRVPANNLQSYKAQLAVGNTAAFAWTVNGAAAGSGNVLNYVFTTPGVYVFGVTASAGGDSLFESLTVTVLDDAPVANDDRYNTPEDSTLAVAASGVISNDSDINDDVLSATLAHTPTQGNVNLALNGSFTFTPALDYTGLVTLGYVLSDGVHLSNMAVVTVSVSAVNDAPIANAGVDLTVTVSATVHLSGSANDVDGPTPIRYVWTQLSGPAVTLVNTNSPTPTFVAPVHEGTLVFRFTASDDAGASHSDTVTVQVRESAPVSPLVQVNGKAGNNQTLNVNTPVLFQARVTAGNNVNYAWILSKVTLGNSVQPIATGSGPIFGYTFSSVGNYQVVLVASNTWGSVSQTILVTVVRDHRLIYLPILKRQ